MKLAYRHYLLSASALFCLHSSAQQPSAETTRPSDELAIYAAILDSSPKLGQASRPLIADSTSTLACDETICNGFTMGGCNGLRNVDETPSARMAIVKRDLPELQTSTIANFEEQNQKCVSIHNKIPTTSDYHLFRDADIPSAWKYSFLVYFSGVGFNPEHTQALINVGLLSSTNANDSQGQYIVLTKKSGKWVLGESSAVWQIGTR